MRSSLRVDWDRLGDVEASAGRGAVARFRRNYDAAARQSAHGCAPDGARLATWLDEEPAAQRTRRVEAVEEQPGPRQLASAVDPA